MEAPWWESIGLDPRWMGSGPLFPSDPGDLSGEAASGPNLRKPLRLDLSEASLRAVPCVGGGEPLTVCGGPWEDSPGTSLGGTHWSVAPEASFSGGYEGSFRARWTFVGLQGSAKVGDGISAQSAGLDAGAFGASLLLGGGRSHRWSDLKVSSPSGSIVLPWNDLTDSGIVSLTLPVGPARCTTSLWKTGRHAVADTGMADTGHSMGWSVAASLPTSVGSWNLSLLREDRILSTTGRFERQVFHSQELSSARAEAGLDWTHGDWEIRAGTRQFRLESPQGDLDHPTVAWNLLARQRFASVYAVAANQQDYLSGSLSIQRWDGGFRRSWNGESWSVRAGLGGFVWTCRANLVRRRLLVVGLIPSVSLDSLASGDGWLAAAGPEAAFAWRTRLGRVELSGSWDAPLAGDWNDRVGGPKRSSGGSNPPLPLDPWSLWSLRVSWSQ